MVTRENILDILNKKKQISYKDIFEMTSEIANDNDVDLNVSYFDIMTSFNPQLMINSCLSYYKKKFDINEVQKNEQTQLGIRKVIIRYF